MLEYGELYERLEVAMEAGDMAWWEMEIPSGVVFFSENKARMLDFPPSQFIHYKNFTDLLHPDDYPGAMKAMQDHMEGKADKYETKYRIKSKSGEYKVFYDRGRIVSKDDKGNMKIAGIVIDVSGLSDLILK